MNYGCHYQPETIPQLNEIYSFKKANDYKTKFYKNVKDIKSGYITYYPDQRQIEDVFTAPNFINTAKIDASLYFNPMGSKMNEYNRTMKKNNLEKQLTWIQDSSEQREDIMALQMRKMNRSLYERKW